MVIAYILPIVFFSFLGEDIAFRAEDTAFGKTYVTKLTADAVLSTPEWDEIDENPPASARSALRAARKMRDSVVKTPDGFSWDRGALILMQPNEYCFWLVRFKAQGEDDIFAMHHLTVIVLMDGTAITPVVSPGKSPNSK